MICPYCVEEIPTFSKKHEDCQVENGREFPKYYLEYHYSSTEPDPVVLSVIGLTGNGKTVFLSALFHYLVEYLPEHWQGVKIRGLDEESQKMLSANQRLLEDGELPLPTPQRFQRPGIFRLFNLPHIPKLDSLTGRPSLAEFDSGGKEVTLLIYDPPGDALKSATKMVEFAPFVRRSDCVVLLIDLSSMGKTIASQMARLLNTYVLAMREMAIKEKSQNLVVVYTKTDEIRDSVPQFDALLQETPELDKYLNDGSPATLGKPRQHLERLKDNSEILKAFTEKKLNARAFTNEARDCFDGVWYTAVSSLGKTPKRYINEKGEQDQRLTGKMSPHGVIDPLLYVLALAKKRRSSTPPWWLRLLAKANILGTRATVVMLSGVASILIALMIAIYFLFIYNADFRRAYACAQEKDYVGAIDNYTKAIAAYPQYAAAYSGRGWAHLEQGNYKLAFEDCNKASQLDPEFPEALTGRGLASAFNYAYDEALSDCAKAIELNPVYAAAYYCRGLTYWYRKKNAQAIEDYKKAIELDPRFTRAYISLGMAYADSGDNEAARRNYQQAAELEPASATSGYYRDSAFAYNHRGVAYLKQAQIDEAISDFDRALEHKQDYAEAYANRGKAYLKKGKYQQGDNDFTHAINLQPENLALYVSRGDARFYMGNSPKAIEDYSHVLDHRVDDAEIDAAEIFVKRGRAFLSIKNWIAAIKDCDNAIKLNSDYLDAYFVLGTAHLKHGESYLNWGESYLKKECEVTFPLGSFHMAVVNYDKVIEHDDKDSHHPEYTLAVYYRGIANANRNHQDPAIEDYNKAIALNPKLAEQRNASYSHAFYKRGAETRSIVDLNQALKLNPNNPCAKAVLARLQGQ